MVSMVSVSGAGTQGSAGLDANAIDNAGTITVNFAWGIIDPNPGTSGSVVINIAPMPGYLVPLDGWATLAAQNNTPGVGQCTIAWTAAQNPTQGASRLIYYATAAPAPSQQGFQMSQGGGPS